MDGVDLMLQDDLNLKVFVETVLEVAKCQIMMFCTSWQNPDFLKLIHNYLDKPALIDVVGFPPNFSSTSHLLRNLLISDEVALALSKKCINAIYADEVLLYPCSLSSVHLS